MQRYERRWMRMETAVKTLDITSENMVKDSLFSYLDKGIDDMEAGKLHSVEEAFRIIRDKAGIEL